MSAQNEHLRIVAKIYKDRSVEERNPRRFYQLVEAITEVSVPSRYLPTMEQSGDDQSWAKHALTLANAILNSSYKMED